MEDIKETSKVNDMIYVLVGTSLGNAGLAIVEARIVQIENGFVTAACMEGLIPNILIHKSDSGIQFHYATRLYTWFRNGEPSKRVSDFLDVQVDNDDHLEYGVITSGLHDLNRAVYALDKLSVGHLGVRSEQEHFTIAAYNECKK